jgi:hypothetical protein
MKKWLMAAGLALGIAVTAPFDARAQVAPLNQPPIATPGTSGQPATGGATGTTDRGQRGEPVDPTANQQPPRGDVLGQSDRPQSGVDRRAQPAPDPPPAPAARSPRTATAPQNERPATTAPTPRPGEVNQRVSQSDRSSTVNRPADSSAAPSARRTLPNTASAVPFIVLGAILAVALGFVIRLGVDSID